MLDTSTPACTVLDVQTVPSWDDYFMQMVDVVARRSKDPNTKIGAIIVGPQHEVRSTGYNSFPRGIRDNVPERLVRPEKYLWLEHSERNAIYNAARTGVSLNGCIIYQSILPCMNCARAIIQVGIGEVVIRGEVQDRYAPASTWNDEFHRVQELFDEAGVHIRRI